MTELNARIERWPIAGSFRISRGSKTEAVVVVAELRDGEHTGRGECTPYARYGETPEGVLADVLAVAPVVGRGLEAADLQSAMPPGAARNALDCALWDLKAKRAATPVWKLAGLAEPGPVVTAFTLSLDTPDAMAAKASALAKFPLLKLKLAGEGDAERLAAVRGARPDARLIVDANEGFRPETLPGLLDICEAAGVELIEQPLPQAEDWSLSLAPRPRSIPICADESAHCAGDVAGLADRYDAVNIKLDKAGGLTEALKMRTAARDAGLKVMVGCMIGTSLAMAPAALVAQGADWTDLDAPLLLAKDRDGGLTYDGARLLPAEASMWGSGWARAERHRRERS